MRSTNLLLSTPTEVSAAGEGGGGNDGHTGSCIESRRVARLGQLQLGLEFVIGILRHGKVGELLCEHLLSRGLVRYGGVVSSLRGLEPSLGIGKDSGSC